MKGNGGCMDSSGTDLDLRDLETLTAVDEHGSLSAASESLGMTVSALSHRLGEMERRWGVTLSTRGPHGLRLTAAALAILPDAQAALRHVHAAERALADPPLSGRGVGVARMLLAGRTGSFLVDVLSEAGEGPSAVGSGSREGTPPQSSEGWDERWTVRVGNSREVESWVANRTVDVGLVRVGGSRPGLRFARVGEDPLMAVCAPALAAASPQGPDPWSLGWIELADHTGHGKAVREELRRAGVRLHNRIETDSLEFAHEAALAGLGAVVLPRSMVISDLATGRLTAIDVPGVLWPSRQIAVVWHAQGEVSGWQAQWARRLAHRFEGGDGMPGMPTDHRT